MRLGANVAAGLVGSVWNALLALAVVPFYLRYLGVEAYGLIGFFMTLQIVLQLLDAGLATTINREVARHLGSGRSADLRTLLHSVAALYWVMALLIGVLVAALAPVIAQRWLGASTIDLQARTHAVMLMGMTIACRWPIALYQGALIGAQRLAAASAVQVVMVTIGHVGAVLLLALWSPTVHAFFVWHAGTALAQAFVLRQAAWRTLGGHGGERFDWLALRRIWRFSAGMSGTAVAAALLTQIDKVLLSRLLSLEDFGRYALAGVVASGLYVVITPVFNAIYPRFSALVGTGDTQALTALYRTGTRLLCSVLFPLGFALAFFAQDVLAVWTGNEALAQRAGPLVALLVMGTALNGAMHFPFALQLAHGQVRLPLLIAAGLAVAMVPLTLLLTARYGATGGAAAWLIVNGAYLFVGAWVTHRYLLVGLAPRWLLADVGLPVAVSFTVMATGAWLSNRASLAHAGHAATLLYAVALGFAAMTITLTLSPDSRRWLRSRLIRRRPDADPGTP